MEEIEKYAKENRIPIMQKDGILYLVNYIKENKITYSKKVEGINMLQRLDPEKVTVYCKHYFSKAYAELKEFSLGA